MSNLFLNLCFQESPLSLLPSPRGLWGRLAGQPSAQVSSSHHQHQQHQSSSASSSVSSSHHHHHHHQQHFQYQDVYTTSRYLGLIFVNNCPHNHTPPPPRNHHHHYRLHDHHLNLQNQDVFTTSPQRRLQVVLSKVQVRPHIFALHYKIWHNCSSEVVFHHLPWVSPVQLSTMYPTPDGHYP